MICNETQFYNYFGRYDSDFNSKFFEDKALISISFSREAYKYNRLMFVDTYDDNTLYCCVQTGNSSVITEKMKTESSQPYVSITMIPLTKNKIENVNDVMGYVNDNY